MSEKRENLRYRTLAKAHIIGVFEGDCLVKDFSITGCCIECTEHLDIKLDTRYKIEILPESASKIGRFDLTVESKWIRAVGYSCDIGFAIVESPKGKLFQRYVDYLAWRTSVT
jgi:hypothetical protein